MNCKDYQTQILISPDEINDEHAEHQAQCSACQVFYDEMRQFEFNIHDAVHVGAPPEILAEIESGHLRFSFFKIIPLLSGLVAVILLGIGLRIAYEASTSKSLENQILLHLKDEPFSLTKVHNQTNRDIALMMDTLGVTIDPSKMQTRFLKRCYMGDKLIAHMVIEGKQGPVTVLFMPNRTVEQIKKFNSQQLDGLIVPAKGSGAIAVIGFTGEPVQTIANKVSKLVEFEI